MPSSTNPPSPSHSKRTGSSSYQTVFKENSSSEVKESSDINKSESESEKSSDNENDSDSDSESEKADSNEASDSEAESDNSDHGSDKNKNSDGPEEQEASDDNDSDDVPTLIQSKTQTDYSQITYMTAGNHNTMLRPDSVGNSSGSGSGSGSASASASHINTARTNASTSKSSVTAESVTAKSLSVKSGQSSSKQQSETETVQSKSGKSTARSQVTSSSVKSSSRTVGNSSTAKSSSVKSSSRNNRSSDETNESEAGEISESDVHTKTSKTGTSKSSKTQSQTSQSLKSSKTQSQQSQSKKSGISRSGSGSGSSSSASSSSASSAVSGPLDSGRDMVSSLRNNISNNTRVNVQRNLKNSTRNGPSGNNNNTDIIDNNNFSPSSYYTNTSPIYPGRKNSNTGHIIDREETINDAIDAEYRSKRGTISMTSGSRSPSPLGKMNKNNIKKLPLNQNQNNINDQKNLKSKTSYTNINKDRKDLKALKGLNNLLSPEVRSPGDHRATEESDSGSDSGDSSYESESDGEGGRRKSSVRKSRNSGEGEGKKKKSSTRKSGGGKSKSQKNSTLNNTYIRPNINKGSNNGPAESSLTNTQLTEISLSQPKPRVLSYNDPVERTKREEKQKELEEKYQIQIINSTIKNTQDKENKKPLPNFPSVVGISDSGSEDGNKIDLSNTNIFNKSSKGGEEDDSSSEENMVLDDETKAIQSRIEQQLFNHTKKIRKQLDKDQEFKIKLRIALEKCATERLIDPIPVIGKIMELKVNGKSASEVEKAVEKEIPDLLKLGQGSDKESKSGPVRQYLAKYVYPTLGSELGGVLSTGFSGKTISEEMGRKLG